MGVRDPVLGSDPHFPSRCTGDIPDLFSDEDVDMIVTSIRMELRGLGLLDTRDNCWSFFIERIRRQLKVRVCQLKVRVCSPSPSSSWVPGRGVVKSRDTGK